MLLLRSGVKQVRRTVWPTQRRWNGFSSSWQQVDAAVQQQCQDENSSLTTVPQPPHPIEYLEGFDHVAEKYKAALIHACSIDKEDFVLDVGCGTATTTESIRHEIGPEGIFIGMDRSEELIERAKLNYEGIDNIQFVVGDVYKMPFASKSFHVVKEDRVLQHLHRPLEALQEMVRCTRMGGTVVVANPDFYSFTMDLPFQRWGEGTRPPPLPDKDNNMRALTTKVLNGALPTLCMHPSIGIQSPRLLRAAGCTHIELQAIPLSFYGLEHLERVVPVSYMARLSQSKGAITNEECTAWLNRLAYEDSNNSLFGMINMYICRGLKPGRYDADDYPWLDSIGDTFFADLPQPTLCFDSEIRLACAETDPDELIEEARAIVNNEYATSDTGSTLSSTRLRKQDIRKMVADKQLLLCFNEVEDLIGCVQVKLKQEDAGGLPSFGNGKEDSTTKAEVVGEFTCLAVTSDIQAKVRNANTPQVSIERSKRRGDESRRGMGVGAALVRAAEAHARSHGATRMTLGIMCPAKGPEPAYKTWLQNYYRKLGYDHKETITLAFETDDDGNVVVDQLHDMYEPLHQLVQCKAILFDKSI